ncbi:MAG: hypothetical protein ABI137_16175, partial [Antricoccus sp.]
EAACEEPPETARRAVLLAARQGLTMTVVDLPRSVSLLREVSSLLDACVVVITPDIKAVLAARRLILLLGELKLPVVAAIRTPKRGGLPYQTVLDVIELPLSGKSAHIAQLRGFNRRLRSGTPVVIESDSLTKSCAHILDDLHAVAERRPIGMAASSV